MGFIERVENFINPDERKFEVKQQAQMELIQMAGGDDIAGTWIDANAKRFNELINDPQYNFYKLLSDKETHDEALLKIKNKLYH